MMTGARRLGPYAPLSATYASDDALIEAGEKAELLFVRSLAFLSTSNSDGYITDNQLTREVGKGMRDAKHRAERLVAVQIFERIEGGYLLGSWLKWNKSAEELGREKKKDRERKSNRIPAPTDSGIPTDSTRNPVGIPADSEPHVRGGAEARQAGALPNHLTSLHSTPHNATERGQALLNEHLDQLRRQPPRDVIRQTSTKVEQLIAEGLPDSEIRAGLRVMRARPNLGPGLLPNLVFEAANPAPPKVVGGLPLADGDEEWMR